jgi:cytochrome b pre-mRNA-processing protein 3
MLENAMLGLFRRKSHERTGFALYAAAVDAAREPAFYTALGVPDSLDGRFDLIGAHVFLLIDRLRAEPEPGPAVAQAVFDAMFADMDFNLREMGVGDMTVGKRVKQMWEAFNGRAKAYEAALAADDGPALAAALARNVWRGAAPVGAPESLAAILRHRRQALAMAPAPALFDGSARFPAQEPVAA